MAAERDELILNATHAVVGYDPANGKELWRVRGNSPITVASPIAQDGMIVATGGYQTPKPIYVLKPGASGDVTPDDVYIVCGHYDSTSQSPNTFAPGEEAPRKTPGEATDETGAETEEAERVFRHLIEVLNLSTHLEVLGIQ